MGCVYLCAVIHMQMCALYVIPMQIGNYRARDHFHQLVPQQELEQRVKEAEEAEGRDLAKNFDALVDMMKKVFVEEHVLRPTAQDLLCEDVMLKGTQTHCIHTHTTSAHHQHTSTSHALTPTHTHTHTHTHTRARLSHTHTRARAHSTPRTSPSHTQTVEERLWLLCLAAAPRYIL